MFKSVFSIAKKSVKKLREQTGLERRDWNFEAELYQFLTEERLIANVNTVYEAELVLTKSLEAANLAVKGYLYEITSPDDGSAESIPGFNELPGTKAAIFVLGLLAENPNSVIGVKPHWLATDLAC
jgi:hypothetical protein